MRQVAPAVHCQQDPARWIRPETLTRIAQGLFVLLVFAPLCSLAFLLLARGDSGDGWQQAVFPDSRRRTLLWESAGLATGVAVSATLMGILVALALWRLRQGRLSRLKWLALIMAPVPPYVHALAWATALRFVSGGTAAGGPFALQGWLLAWWVETMAFLPIAAGLCLLGLEAVHPSLIESGRVVRSDLRTLTRIVLPLAGPGILASFVAVLLLSLADYSVPSIFGVEVYALEIFAGYSASANPREAILLAAPLAIVAIVVVLASQRALRDATFAASPRPLADMTPLSFPIWFQLIERVGLTLLTLQILVPLTVLSVLLDQPADILQTVQLAAADIRFSLWIAAMSAVVCLGPALGAAYALLSERRTTRIWWLMTILPLAIPAPLVGIGLIVIWNRPGSVWLYDSAWMPVVAALARFLPWAGLVVLAQLKRLDQTLLDAARVYGKSRVLSWLRIDLPMVAPGLVAAAVLVFALTLGELGATLLVTPPGRSTLTIRIYNYLHYGGSGEVAALCIVMLGAGMAAAVTIWAALASWSRLARREP
jgi:iron(III) transport system permease protein